MNPLRRLAGQTAIYGLSTIVGRLLNYFLVPIYTRVFLPEQYGVITEIYAYVTFLKVIYTYGMETAFFRFSQMESDKSKVYSTNLLSILFSSVLFALVLVMLSTPIAEAIKYPGKGIYITWFAMILGLDAIAAIPFAQLRLENKAKRYALIMLLNIMINFCFNMFFLIICPWIIKGDNTLLKGLINPIYSPEIGVGYVFISNLISSAVTLLFLAPELFRMHFSFDKVLWKRMLIYSFPLLIGGFAGMINETIDRLLLKHLVADKASALEQLGIYGACYKVSIAMTIFVQTFRQAAEPFFFTEARTDDSKKVYADVMKYFILACSFIFIGVMMNMDIVKHFVGIKYRVGLKVVPILLLANLCLGIFFNLSIWYKLTGQTRFGAYLSIFGALVTLVLNFWWIPIIGYMGAAWATLVCYASMMAVSYIIGQRYYPVEYHVSRILSYLGLAIGLYFLSIYTQDIEFFNRFTVDIFKVRINVFNNFLLLTFIFFAWLKEKPMSLIKTKN